MIDGTFLHVTALTWITALFFLWLAVKVLRRTEQRFRQCGYGLLFMTAAFGLKGTFALFTWYDGMYWFFAELCDVIGIIIVIRAMTKKF